MKVSKIALYTDGTALNVRAKDIALHMGAEFGLDAECHLLEESPDFSKCLIRDIRLPPESQTGGADSDMRPMYDGICMQQAYTDAIPDVHRCPDWMHIIFTEKLAATYDYDGYRYHARALVGANPALVSVSGMIEAPARPREYYISQSLKMPYAGWNGWLEYEDVRITDAAKGYAVQALAYYIIGGSFCKNPRCVLYNAHWQQEMIRSHIESGSLCKDHAGAVRRSIGRF